ncbi:MAG: hypothetical protein J5634_00385 [Bacilli bacterium]|nr:hypothetical protein [Bacilli bacterium]
MKGDGYINIRLNFKGILINKNNKVYINIYDKNNCLVCCKETSKPYLDVCLNKCSIYKIVICYHGYKIVRTIYINQCIFNIYFNYITNTSNRKSGPITFNLVDYNYNLPIERGILNFEQTSNNN